MSDISGGDLFHNCKQKEVDDEEVHDRPPCEEVGRGWSEAAVEGDYKSNSVSSTKSACSDIAHTDEKNKAISFNQVARICRSDTANLMHVYVRDDYLKNDNLLLTHSPNVLESDQHVTKVTSDNLIQTKPLENRDSTRIEGRIAQYPRGLKLFDNDTGRGYTDLADKCCSAKSSA